IGGSWASSNSPGIYCLTGGTATLFISNIDLTGGAGYTFFAPYLDISGGSYKNYSPQPAGDPPTPFFASKDIFIHGQGANITGDIFAPNGNVALAGGSASAGSGFIESQTLTIQGNYANFHGTGPAIGTTTIPGAVHTTTDADTVIAGTTNPGTT